MLFNDVIIYYADELTQQHQQQQDKPMWANPNSISAAIKKSSDQSPESTTSPADEENSQPIESDPITFLELGGGDITESVSCTE